MRGLLLAGGFLTIVLLCGAWSNSATGQDDKVYDLRGPAPQKGQVFRSEMRLKIKNADTTLANLAGMSFPVLSGEEWMFLAVSFTSGNATADVKYTVTAPAASTGRFGLSGSGIPLTAGSSSTFGNAVAMAVSDSVTQVLVSGYVVAGANGTVQIQAAQNTSDASDTVFYANSFIIALRRVAA